MQARGRKDLPRLVALRDQIEIGIRALDAGDFDEVDFADLDRYLARLASRRRAGERGR
jgi:hypothetical protein